MYMIMREKAGSGFGKFEDDGEEAYEEVGGCGKFDGEWMKREKWLLKE